MNTGAMFLVVLSALAWASSLFNVTNVTTGVWLAVSACGLAIFARMSQAEHQHKEQMQRLEGLIAWAAKGVNSIDPQPPTLREEVNAKQ